MTDETRPHWFGPSSESSKGKGHPILFSFEPAAVFDAMPDGGGYPKGFVELAYRTLGVTDPTRVLHLCSGSMRVGVRVDVRAEMRPTVVADVRRLPFPDETFDWAMADPPYSEEYAANLYGTAAAYPRPGELLREAARVLRPGGRVGILHFMVPMVRRPLTLERVYGVTTGSGYAIRAWTVLEKSQRELIGADEVEGTK